VPGGIGSARAVCAKPDIIPISTRMVDFIVYLLVPV
jgi:hypothetical protein